VFYINQYVAIKHGINSSVGFISPDTLIITYLDVGLHLDLAYLLKVLCALAVLTDMQCDKKWVRRQEGVNEKRR